VTRRAEWTSKSLCFGSVPPASSKKGGSFGGRPFLRALLARRASRRSVAWDVTWRGVGRGVAWDVAWRGTWRGEGNCVAAGVKASSSVASNRTAGDTSACGGGYGVAAGGVPGAAMHFLPPPLRDDVTELPDDVTEPRG
jgi:hypothetical protein